jgi:mannose-6-phosphate isomerase-like protein (cupin superfamily)
MIVEGYVLRDAPGWTWKANGRDNDGRFDFLVISHFAYGAGPPLHFHLTLEDSFFVLEGVLTVQLGDDIVELGPGDFATAPPGVPHSLTNAHADQSPCRVVNLLTPGVGFDRYISQIDQLAEKGDHEGMERLNAEYDVTIVGPSVADRLGLS